MEIEAERICHCLFERFDFLASLRCPAAAYSAGLEPAPRAFAAKSMRYWAEPPVLPQIGAMMGGVADDFLGTVGFWA
jgi:hypothetical protein